MGVIGGLALVNILNLFNLTIPLGLSGSAVIQAAGGGDVVTVTPAAGGWTAGSVAVTGLAVSTTLGGFVNTGPQARDCPAQASERRRDRGLDRRVRQRLPGPAGCGPSRSAAGHARATGRPAAAGASGRRAGVPGAHEDPGYNEAVAGARNARVAPRCTSRWRRSPLRCEAARRAGLPATCSGSAPGEPMGAR
jgi:hypothetical protein